MNQEHRTTAEEWEQAAAGEVLAQQADARLERRRAVMQLQKIARRVEADKALDELTAKKESPNMKTERHCKVCGDPFRVCRCPGSGDPRYRKTIPQSEKCPTCHNPVLPGCGCTDGTRVTDGSRVTEMAEFTTLRLDELTEAVNNLAEVLRDLATVRLDRPAS